MNKLFITLVPLLLTGCASSTYVVPKNDTTGKQKLATLSGNSERKGFYNWENSKILSIDNKDVSYGFKSKTSYKIPVTAMQEHTFVVNTTFNRSLTGGGPYAALLDVKAKLKPGMDYKIKDDVDGAKVKIWIEDESGKRVSSIASAPYSAQWDHTVMIPVMIR